MRILMVVIMAVLVLFSHASELGISCSRPSRVMLDQGRKLQANESKAQTSTDSHQAPMASQTLNHTISNCGELCSNGSVNAMLVKGPVPPSGPSHRGNAAPNDR